MTRRETNDMEDVTSSRMFRFMIICQWLALAAIAGLVVAGLIFN